MSGKLPAKRGTSLKTPSIAVSAAVKWKGAMSMNGMCLRSSLLENFLEERSIHDDRTYISVLKSDIMLLQKKLDELSDGRGGTATLSSSSRTEEAAEVDKLLLKYNFSDSESQTTASKLALLELMTAQMMRLEQLAVSKTDHLTGGPPAISAARGSGMSRLPSFMALVDRTLELGSGVDAKIARAREAEAKSQQAKYDSLAEEHAKTEQELRECAARLKSAEQQAKEQEQLQQRPPSASRQLSAGLPPSRPSSARSTSYSKPTPPPSDEISTWEKEKAELLAKVAALEKKLAHPPAPIVPTPSPLPELKRPKSSEDLAKLRAAEAQCQRIEQQLKDAEQRHAQLQRDTAAKIHELEAQLAQASSSSRDKGTTTKLPSITPPTPPSPTAVVRSSSPEITLPPILQSPKTSRSVPASPRENIRHQDLAKKHQELESRQRALEERCATLEQTIRMLEEEKSDALREGRQAADQLSDHKALLQHTRQEVLELKAALVRMEGEKGAADTLLRDAKSFLEAYSTVGHFDEVRERMERTAHELDSLRKDFKESQAELTVHAQREVGLRESHAKQLQQLQRELATAQLQQEHKEDFLVEAQGLRDQVQSLCEERDALTMELAKVRDWYHEGDRKSRDIINVLTKRLSESAAVSTRNEDLTREVSMLRGVVLAKEDQVREMRTQLNEVNTKFSSAISKLQATEAAVLSKVRDRDQVMETGMKRSTAEMAALRSEKESLAKRAADAEKEVQAVRSRVDELHRMLAQSVSPEAFDGVMMQELRMMREAFEQKLRNVQAEAEKMKSRNFEQLQAITETVQAERAIMESKQRRLNARIQMLEERLAKHEPV